MVVCRAWTLSSKRAQSWSPRAPWPLRSFSFLAWFVLSCWRKPFGEQSQSAKLAVGSCNRALEFSPTPFRLRSKWKPMQVADNMIRSPNTRKWKQHKRTLTFIYQIVQALCKLTFIAAPLLKLSHQKQQELNDVNEWERVIVGRKHFFFFRNEIIIKWFTWKTIFNIHSKGQHRKSP